MIYAFGSFELDTRVFELRESGVVRPVEPQVFNVLVYLAANRDRVISKEELLENVWHDRFVSETTLTSRLKEARKAVGDTGKAQLVIRTQHGRGYRFVAEVREHDGETVVTPRRVPAPRPTGFVGREAELERLDAALSEAATGKRKVVFVAGEAGAGKTTLVEAFLARHAQLLAARGQCVEHRGSGEPYMPLLDALGRLCRANAASIEVLRRVAPSWLVQMPWLVPDDELAVLRSRTGAPGERMLRELGMAIEQLTAAATLIILLEDLHWSDFATLEAIDLLAKQPHAARVLVIGTYRPADVKASKHPVYAVAHELRARKQCDVVALPLLAVRELEEYLALRLPDAAHADLAVLLHKRTSGNPLFVGNLVDSWVTRGCIGAPLETLARDVPDSLQQLIEKQIAALSDEEQRMLETASVIGREFPAAIVAATLPADDDDVERRCEAFARVGRFLRAAGTEQWGDGTFTSRFAFTHDLYVDVLYERIPLARRTRLHQQAGLALERAWQGRERERAAELALHFQRAQDRERAIRYLQLAAEQALGRSAYREAALHFAATVELILELPPSIERDRRELAIRARLAPAIIATRGWGDVQAEKNYFRGVELARQHSDMPHLSQLLYGLAIMYEYRGEYVRAERIALERLALDETSTNLIESHELLTCAMLHQGRYVEAVRHAELAFAAGANLPVDVPNTLLLVQTHGWVSGAKLFVGQDEEALAHNREALRLAEAIGDELAKASALLQAGFLRFYRREVEECRKLAEAGSAIARERRFPFLVSCGRILLGWCLSYDGEHDEAVREIRAGIRTAQMIGARMDVPLFLAILAESLTRSGDRNGAVEALEDAMALVNRHRSFFYLPELYRMTAHLVAERDRDTAVNALRRALAIAEEQQSPLFCVRVRRSLEAFAAGAEEADPMAVVQNR